MDSQALHDLTNAIIDRILHEARIGIKKLPAVRTERIREYEEQIMSAQKDELEHYIYELLMEHLDLPAMADKADQLYEEMVAGPAREQDLMDAAISNHEARRDDELHGGV